MIWSPKSVRAHQISMLSSVLWDGTLTSTSKEPSPAFLLCYHRDSWAECVDRSEVSLMKLLSSPRPLKCRSFKGINHRLSWGKVFYTSYLKQNLTQTHKQDQHGGLSLPFRNLQHLCVYSCDTKWPDLRAAL